MRKLLAIVLITLIFISTLTACGKNDLIGTWTLTEDGSTIELTLKKGGTGDFYAPGFGTVDVKWAANSKKISAATVIDGETTDFFSAADYSIKDNKLTVTTEKETFVLTKKE